MTNRQYVTDRIRKRFLAVVTACAVALTLVVPVSLAALPADTSGPNTILYDGTSVDGIHRMGGMDISYEVRKEAAAYGDALAINPTKVQGSGWAALPLAGMGEDVDFSATQGIAMYVKIPHVTATNLVVRIINDGWSSWAEIGTNVELTFVSKDGTRETKTQELPFENMQGFEGFVFIPYEALTGSGTDLGRKITDVMAAEGWNIEISYYKRNEDEIGVDYLYDNIGIYSDIDAYIEQAAADRVSDKINTILYDGTSVEGLRKMGGTDISYEVRKDAAAYGDALAINPTKVQGSGWAVLPLAGMGEDVDFSATQGIAMYVKIPHVTATNLVVRIINDGWSSWAEIGTNVELTFVSKDGTRETKTQELPFENMQGFEGFVFIPYEALTGSGTDLGRKITDVMAAEGWNIEISYYKRNEDEIGVDYLYDNIGIYSDIDEYIAKAEGDRAIDPANPILYDGSSTEGITNKGGMDIMWEVRQEATKYQSALAINPTKVQGSGWAALSLKKAQNVDFSSLSGIAMYVKIPEVTQTNLTVRIINDGWSSWAEIATNVELTFVSKDGVKETKLQEYPFENMQGFEGFVFIPYEALTASSSTHPGREITDVMAAEGWNIEISYYKWNEDEIGVDYLYDNIGFYSDIDAYIAAADRLVEDTQEPEEPDDPGFTGGEWVANEGDASKIVVDPSHGQDVEVKESSVFSKYGKGVAINPTKTLGGGWAAVSVEKPEEFDFRGTKGVVTYVRFPEGVTETNLTIRLIKNDWSAWSEIATGITVTLVDKNGVKKEQPQTKPYENLQGYEGFVFIPYEAFSAGSTPVDPEALNTWEDWSIEIGYYKWNQDEIGPDYLFYNFGFYTDIDAYIAMMDARHPNFIANTGTLEGTRVVGSSTIEPEKDVAIELREDATQFGDALAIYPTKTFSGNWGDISVQKPEGFDFSKTKGLAVYIKFPTTPVATNLTIRLIREDWSNWFEIGVNTTLTTVSVMGDKKSVGQYLPFENMQGFEGFVFIPYEALYAGNPGQVDFDMLNSWEEWSVEVGYYMHNEADVNVDYLFDNIGFYSDIDEYIALCGFVPQDKPSDTAYYNNQTDSQGWYLVNNMLDGNATTFGGFGSVVLPTTDTDDGAGLEIQGQKEFRVVLKNFRFGDSSLKNTAGLMYYMRADEAISGLNFTIGITDETNPEAVEIYEFDSYEGDYYYAPQGSRLFKVSRDAVYFPAGFEGYVYFPFETFLPSTGSMPDNLVVDPDGITQVSITAEPNNAEQGSTQLILDNLMFYSTQDLLETMIGAPQDPRDYDILAQGEGSAFVHISAEAVRLYNPNMTYAQLANILTVDGGNVELQLLDNQEQPVKGEDKVASSFLLAVLRSGNIIRRLPVSVVTQDIVPDDKVLVQEGTPGVPDREVVVEEVVYDEIFVNDPVVDDEEEDPLDPEFPEDEEPLITIKQSASAFVELDELSGGLTVHQNMAAVRFLSAFNVAEGATLSLLDPDGNACADNKVVGNNFTLVVFQNDVEAARYTIQSTVSEQEQPPEVSDPDPKPAQNPKAGMPVWAWILIGVGVVLLIGAAVLVIVLVKKNAPKHMQKS